LEKGKIRAIVKSARKPKSKLAGVTEIFTHGEFTLAKGKNLDIVMAVTPLDYFQKAAGDLNKISLLFFISETLEKLLPREVPNEKIFEETLGVFRVINRTDKAYVAYEYLYKLVVLLGYGLSLLVCSKCHKKTESLSEKNNALNLASGGILCKKCSSGSADSTNLSASTIKLLKYIETHDFPDYSKVKFNDNAQKEIAGLVTSYLNHIYQKELKSPGFIKSIKALK